MVKALIDSPQDVPNYLKSVTVKDAMHLANPAWGDVKSSTVRNCWVRGIGKLSDACTEMENDSIGTNDESDSDEEFLGFTDEEVQQATDKLAKVMEKLI